MKITRMQIHPVRTEHDRNAALQRIEVLMQAAPGSAEGDELDILATLVDAYEAKHFVIDAPSPIVAIEFRMDQQGLTRKDLEPYLGSRARVSEIMTGRRSLTLPMIQRLRDGLGIPADILIGPPSGTMRTAGTKLRTRHGSAGKVAATRGRKTTTATARTASA